MTRNNDPVRPAVLSESLAALPESLQSVAQQHCQTVSAAAEKADVSITDPQWAGLPKLLACSVFAARLLERKPGLIDEICDAQGPRPAETELYLEQLGTELQSCGDLPELKRRLRTIRQREMLRLAWRDLLGLDELDITLAGLSALADALVDAALAWLQARHVERFGQPLDREGRPVELVVLGMGKLGGLELNFSSDIDLIFAYREPGQTPGPRVVSHEEYFRGLAQQLVQVLNEHTEHGFVFRVDTRLRPFGDSGPLVMHFDAMEQYYQTHGREWERYAWIKARPIAGCRRDGEALLRILRPFVFRRYLDYSVYDALRDMKAMIERETVRKNMQGNIKLGRGGIREIEFIVQVYQLIRGGQDVELQQRRLREVLALLADKELLPQAAAGELDDAYVFLRRLENRLQAYRDEQTHDLPKDALRQSVLALAMGVADWEELAARIGVVREQVYTHFRRVFGQEETEPAGNDELASLWLGKIEQTRALSLLNQLGFEEAETVLEELRHLREAPRVRGLGETARRRLDECLPLLMRAAAETGAPSVVLQRMLRLMQALVGRSTYIALLIENPTAIPQLARLCAASPWIAEQLQQHPMLLDNLLDPRQLYAPPRRAELSEELQRQIEQFEALDLERLMDCVRRFKQNAVLRVAAADISNAVPLMVVSDHLTEIAEVVLAHALRATQQQLREKHGRPLRADGSEVGFAVIAYGKFGGIELGYGSDLDLVFVHDGEASGMTDGQRPILHEVYFNRLGQRLMHFLSAYTPAGRAYEIDMRLRPNGESGLLVPGFEALAKYQHEQAWTWEHQALVRARPVAGSESLGQRFIELRHQVLSSVREAEPLREAVAKMRSKMRDALEKREAGKLDLKQGSGGIADIEFITQYFVLRYSNEFPELTRWTDNIRILETLGACGLWTDEEVQRMCDAYRNLRRAIHRQALQAEPALVDAADFAGETASVRACWERHLGTTTAGD